MKNWKCKIGLHDWEYITARGRCEFVDSIRYPLLANGFRNNERPLVYKRICLRCIKYEDTMTPLKFETITRIKLENKRQITALKLFEENQIG
jgi:hypothetical protein